MEDFKRMVKMKAGGCVSEAAKKACGGKIMKKKEGGKVHDDEAQDKVLIKKMIDKEEKGEKPELKLKKGGRTAKAEGSVKKFKAGGKLDVPSKAAVKEKETPAKETKPVGDKDAVVKVKPTGDKKADILNKAAVKPNRSGENAIDDMQKAGGKVPAKKAGGKIKKFADGGMTGTPNIPPAILEQMRRAKMAQDSARMAASLKGMPQGGGVPPQGMPQGGGMPPQGMPQGGQQITPQMIQALMAARQGQAGGMGAPMAGGNPGLGQ